ncbi:MAG: hypothetical protein IJB67_07770 [Firmicutes bacterium]|nr:hypothetical protein [Bacillota bacterium]
MLRDWLYGVERDGSWAIGKAELRERRMLGDRLSEDERTAEVGRLAKRS